MTAEPSVAEHAARLAERADEVALPTRPLGRADRPGSLPDCRPPRLGVVPGKLVWELRPAERSDKGDAVRRVVAESGVQEVVMVGDDLGDLPAFAAAAELAAEGRDGLRVAVRSAEAPPALLNASWEFMPHG
jgi:trehalose 6-phosphate phosphatase